MTASRSPAPARPVAAWGATDAPLHRVRRPTGRAEAARVLAQSPEKILARGLGRSYGDVALNPGGALVDMTGLDRFIAFDRASGVLEVESGVSLGEILETVCRPDADGAWFLPVTPGTRHVTIGGAIANDVHGKNHHRRGTFGRHVLGLTLARSDGRVLDCGPRQNADLFSATVGGLGLTGLILTARLQLVRVAGLALESEHIAFTGLSDFFDLAQASEADWDYTVGWVDCLASGKAFGRGVFSRARHVPGGSVPPPAPAWKRLPATPPFPLVNSVSVRAFNALHWRRAPRARGIEDYARNLYPLDGISDWNRLYGRHGFFQFQCVVPAPTAREGIDRMLRRIGASGEGSMLSVIKTFNDMPSPGLLSFPMPGTTLAVDFANRGDGTRALLSALEGMAAEAGGRIYPAKDAVMTRETFAAGYGAALPRFLPQIDPGLSSGFARRVGLLGDGDD